MQIKLDENLPAVLVNVLAEFGHEADTSPQEGLAGSRDEEIWEAAVRTGRFLITQDLDFSDVRKFVPGTHPGLLLLRLDHPSRTALVRRIRQILGTEEIDSWKGCLVVASEHKIRVRRP
jgi:predicted nuclease of predicted toxin-antitoxin system